MCVCVCVCVCVCATAVVYNTEQNSSENQYVPPNDYCSSVAVCLRERRREIHILIFDIDDMS